MNMRDRRPLANGCLLALLSTTILLVQELSSFAARFTAMNQFPSEMSSRGLVAGTTFPCHVKLTGQIDEGDLAALKSYVPKALFKNDREEVFVVCLDSSGGNFLEGVRIAKYFIEAGITTQIEDGAMCFSACAVAFMGGTHIHWEDGRFISRYLHVTGHLGFHAPALSVPSGKYNESTVEAAYRAAIAGIAELASLGQKNETLGLGEAGRTKLSLIEILLRTRPEDMYLINTTGKAARWGIDLVGWTAPVLQNKGQFSRLCSNLIRGLSDSDAEGKDVEGSQDNEMPEFKQVEENGAFSMRITVLSDRAGYYGSGCEVVISSGFTAEDAAKLPQDRHFSNSEYLTYYNDEAHGLKGQSRVQAWYVYPANTPIDNLRSHAGRAVASSEPSNIEVRDGRLAFNDCEKVLNAVVTCKTLPHCDKHSVDGHFSQVDYQYFGPLEQTSSFRTSNFLDFCSEVCRSRAYFVKGTRLALCGY